MAAKKEAPKKAPAQSSSEGGMGSTWKWVYIVGVLVAAVAGAIGFQHIILTLVLIVAGLLVGWLYFDPEDVEHFGLRYLILFAVQAVLSAVPAVGPYITGFLGGLVAFLGPVVLAMLAHFFWNKRIAPLF